MSCFRILFGAVFALVLASIAFGQTSEMRQLKNAGPTSSRINMVFLGDGYTTAQKDQFFSDATVRMNAILSDEAMAPYTGLTNGFAIFTASNESGTTIPAENLAPDTYYQASFTAGESSRLVYVANSTGIQRINTVLAANAPGHDYVVLLVNSTRYGGAGGFPMVASLSEDSIEVLLHESGHSFAGLADEYIDAATAPQHPEAEFANSTLLTERAQISWRKFIADSTPIPTTGVPADPVTVGLWEGSHYRPTGNYRPLYDSKMRSLDRPWGPVNLRAFADGVHERNINQATTQPSIATPPDASAYVAGGSLSLTAVAGGVGPFSYQWIKDGKYLHGETTASLSRTDTTSDDYGSYTIEISNAAGTEISTAVTISAANNGGNSGGGGGNGDGSAGRLTNLSVRSRAGSGSETLTVGFVVGQGATGSTKSLLVRAIGPTLTDFGVSNALSDPSLVLAPLNEASIAGNDNWSGDATLVSVSNTVGAFSLIDPASLDAALVETIGSGPFTAQVNGAHSSPGIALVEVYDADTSREPRLVNLSARSRVGSGADVLIAGFVLEGPGSMRLLIRAIGPTLGGFGVAGALPDPVLTIRAQNSLTVLAENDNWAGDAKLIAAFTTTGAFALPDDDSRDAVVIVEIPPGAYTATVADVGGAEGVALIEVYEIP